MVSSTPRPHFTPGKDPVPILQEAENLVPTRIRSQTVQPVAQSLYRPSYTAHGPQPTYTYFTNMYFTISGSYHVSAGRHRQGAHNQIVENSQQKIDPYGVIYTNVQIMFKFTLYKH